MVARDVMTADVVTITAETLVPEIAKEFVKTHGLRAADVMTAEVVTVTDDTPLPAIAQILEERRVKRVPVVREGRFVGIVSRADLLRAVAARKTQSELASKPDDRAIRERLLETIRSADWVTDTFVNVMVTDGVVHLWGVVESDVQRDALRVAAERIPGVRAVEDHLGKLPPWSSAI